MQASLMDYKEGQRLKNEGMEKASSFPFDTPIGKARNIAILLAKKNGEVCVDDVYVYMAERMPEVLKEIPDNGWGSVVKSPRLKFTGRITESKRISRHCGSQRLWCLA